LDFATALKSEIFRPFSTIIVPGTIALAPFLPVVAHFNPELPRFWNAHGAAFVALLLVAIVATGFALENIGARIEVAWDRLIAKERKAHSREWVSYLKLEMKDELVGQRYLRGVVTRLKFELACAPALVIGCVGLGWSNHVTSRWEWCNVALTCLFALSVAAFLLNESWSGAKVASQTRRLILAAKKTRRVKSDQACERHERGQV
jgi:hypothetical protein